MSNFKPQVVYTTNESLREYSNDYSGSKNKFIRKTYNTYRELKKELKDILAVAIEYDDSIVSVTRSRAGEWGEWFEYWKLVNGKPKIIKQGWN